MEMSGVGGSAPSCLTPTPQTGASAVPAVDDFVIGSVAIEPDNGGRGCWRGCPGAVFLTAGGDDGRLDRCGFWIGLVLSVSSYRWNGSGGRSCKPVQK